MPIAGPAQLAPAVSITFADLAPRLRPERRDGV